LATTLVQLEDIFYAILREDWPSSAYPQVLADLFLNAAQQDILGGRVIHPLTNEEAKAGDLYFINSDAYYEIVAPTSLTADIAIWATTIYADTTDYPATGKLYLWGQVVSYTWKTATSFTWVSGVLFGFVSWTRLQLCFDVPADYFDIIEIIYNNDFKLDAQQYDSIFSNENSYKASNSTYVSSPYNATLGRNSAFYTIKDGAYIIPFNLTTTGAFLHLRYKTIPDTMITLPAPVNCTIDNDIYAQLCIPHLAVAEMLFERWEENRAGMIYNNAIKNCRKMYSRYNQTSFESQNNTQVKSWHGHVNI
jgi:hypothetical protein